MQGQARPMSYSAYVLIVKLEAPKGMPAFDGIPAIVLN